LVKLTFVLQELSAGSEMDQGYIKKISNKKRWYLISKSEVKMIFVARFWKAVRGNEIIQNN